MLNHVQRNLFKLDRSHLITYCSGFLFHPLQHLERREFLNGRPIRGKVMADEKQSWFYFHFLLALPLYPARPSRTRIPFIYSFIHSFRSFHIPIRTVITERHLIESMLYCSAYKLPTRGLAWLNRGCAQC